MNIKSISKTISDTLEPDEPVRAMTMLEGRGADRGSVAAEDKNNPLTES